MVGRLRALCAVLVLAAAVSMAAASTASASAVLTGEQTTQNVFQITPTTGPAATCTQAVFEGTATDPGSQATTSDLSLSATYSGCQAFGQIASIRTNGCKYTITGNQADPLTALVDITGCTAGKQIEIQTGICQITVPEQSGLSHVTFENKEGLPGDVEASLAISGIKYELHGFVCGHTLTAPTTDGTLTGKATLRAYEDEGSEQVTAHGHQYSKLKDGDQLELGAGVGELHVGPRCSSQAGCSLQLVEAGRRVRWPREPCFLRSLYRSSQPASWFDQLR